MAKFFASSLGGFDSEDSVFVNEILLWVETWVWKLTMKMQRSY